MDLGWCLSGAVLCVGLAYVLLCYVRDLRRRYRARKAIAGTLACDLPGCSQIAVWDTDLDWFTCDDHRPVTMAHYPLPGYAGTSRKRYRRRRRQRVPIDPIHRPRGLWPR